MLHIAFIHFFYHFSLLIFLWSITFLQQNTNQSETWAGGQKLLVKLYEEEAEYLKYNRVRNAVIRIFNDASESVDCGIVSSSSRLAYCHSRNLDTVSP